MDADTFLETAKDPANWLMHSLALRRSADRLWEAFGAATVAWAKKAKALGTESAEAEWEEAVGYITTSKLLYGLALETAFKAHIAAHYPEQIEFDVTRDKDGTVQEVQLKRIGVSMSSGHNLERLAIEAGLFRRDTDPVFPVDSDYKAIREIIRELGDTVTWSGRYPVPRRSSMGYELPPDVPARIFGHFIRDWLDRVLDRYQTG